VSTLARTPPAERHEGAPRTLLNFPFALTLCAIRVSLGAVLLLGGVSKLREPYEFLSALYGYELVGREVGWWIAAAGPWLELFVGISLILGVVERGAWTLAFALLLTFTVAKVSVLHRGMLVPCGCGAPIDDGITLSSVLTTVLMLIGALIGLASSVDGGRRGKGVGKTA